ncbi:MAG: TonB-dependent receptor [Acidobacteriota bacterium]
MRNSKRNVLVALLAVGLLLAPQVMAQNPTGTLRGTVTDEQGAGLPGVTVTATSPRLQGERTTQTGANGGYKLGFLPPGEYKVSYELEGFATKIQNNVISAAQTRDSDIQMQLAEVVEEIIVTSNVDTISESTTGASTYTSDEMEKLPVARTLAAAVNLAPGVHNTAPAAGDAISINGAMSFENVFMINGVVINENVRGQSLPLFVEDAIQETTVQTSGISAEYGRFTGGVVNVITKSGGNQFSGSLRVNFVNDDWESQTPLSGERVDDVNQIYEATLGGPIWKDKIWFFASFRDLEENGTDQTDTTNIVFPSDDLEDRTEGKLTVTPHPSHQLQGSYLELNRTRTNVGFGPVRQVDVRSFSPNRTDPQEITSGNYTGILTSSLFIEAQYSEREFAIGVGSGGPSGDLINGTFIRSQGGDAGRVQYHSPFFCGDCETEIRNNDNTLVKGSYFLTTDNAGSHDIAFGYDTFTDIRFSVNHQTGSDFQVWAQTILITGDANNTIYPVLDANSWLVWWPPVNLDIAAPTDFKTNSFYINDSWQLNDKWSFNIGVRYDENDGQDSGGATTVDDNKVSPRLGFSYDVKGDGDLVINGSYGTYVAAIANTRADSTSQGGALAGFGFFYGGPSVNTNCQANGFVGCTSTEDALQTVFDWYLANGGVTDVTGDLSNLPNLIFACIPGVTQVVPDTLRSPAADELTVGVTKRLGSKGLVRADIIFREWEDFYSNRTLPNNIIQTDAGPQDLTEVGNFGDGVLERDYIGINLNSRYRITDRFTLSGTYTWSELEGNINGEGAGAGPTPVSPLNFAEYSDNAWNLPVGPLLADQRHKLRVWGIYDILENERHSLSVSLLQNFFSGTPYSTTIDVDTNPFVTNPGYADPPDNVTYFVGGRGSLETDDITRTDISLNYSFRWNAFGKSMEVFIQPEIINLFNEDGVEAPNTDTNDAENDGSLATFNPFTTTPVEGVHWTRGNDFGQATNEDDFQDPRLFRISVGFRF